MVEGNILKEAFHWKKAIGPNDIRPGHWDLWGYWNTDGALPCCSRHSAGPAKVGHACALFVEAI